MGYGEGGDGGVLSSVGGSIADYEAWKGKGLRMKLLLTVGGATGAYEEDRDAFCGIPFTWEHARNSKADADCKDWPSQSVRHSDGAAYQEDRIRDHYPTRAAAIKSANGASTLLPSITSAHPYTSFSKEEKGGAAKRSIGGALSDLREGGLGLSMSGTFEVEHA